MPTQTTRAHKSVKHDIISKDNTKILAAIGAGVFIVVFCGFAIRALFSQSLYHNRVIDEKTKALRQLEVNKAALNDLVQSYNAFVSEPENILGGNPTGEGPLDGNNAKVVLDALPGAYDYPALSSSFEKILKEGNYEINSLGGSEDGGVQNVAVGNVQPINVPYTFAFSSDLAGTQALLGTLERSIRPMYVDTLGIQIGGDGSLRTSVSLHTFYTQQKTFELGSKGVE